MSTPLLTAEVVALGDELTSGARLDTNSQWISRALTEQGIHVVWHTCVGDQQAALVETFRIAANRVDIVVTSGGLGPTADDLTREALAEVAGVPLSLDEPSMTHIQAIFARRKRPMPERNRQQAMLPQGAVAIPNPLGTAPGIALKLNSTNDDCDTDGQLDTARQSVHFYSLPGVPVELKEMWQWVRDDLANLLPEQRTTIHHELHCFGAGESDVEAMLPDLIQRGRDPSVGITASEATITLRVTASGADESACRDRMAETIQIIRDSLGELIFGEDGAQLQDVVLGALASRGETLTTLEAGSCGQLAMWLSQADDVRLNTMTSTDRAYLGGSVFKGKTRSATELSRDELHGELVEQTIRQLKTSNAAWAVGIGDYPRGDSSSGDAGTISQEFPVVIVSHRPLTGEGVGEQEGVNYSLRKFPFASHPSIAATRAAKIALNALRKQLLRSEQSPA